jgi:hypothetical protein
MFYNDVHYVWCSPVFDATTLDDLHPWKNIGQTSNPHLIYISYKAEINSRDRHLIRTNIENNKKGIKHGAAEHLKAGKINEMEFAYINEIVEQADLSDFRPVLYLISHDAVRNRVQKVPVDKRANPLGLEFQILDLNGFEFEKIIF